MTARIWFTRIAYTAVFAMNVMCALQFIIAPEDFAAAYQLTGASGNAALRGLGVAFLMWNATYPLFIAKPSRYPWLGWIVVSQQLIGLVGESCILFSLPAGNDVLASSIERFIIFDGAGLALMLAAILLLTSKMRSAITREQ